MSCGDANRNTDPEQPASSHEAVPSSSLAPWLHGSALGKVFTGMRTDFWTIALDNDLNRRPAVTDGTSGRTLSYAEFGICAGRLALGVRLALGPCHEPPVLALCRNRGAGMVVCMWACQLAGGVYSPMNHTLPVDRKKFIMENTGSRVLLTEPEILAQWPAEAIPDGVLIVPLDAHDQPLSGIDCSALPSQLHAIHEALEALLSPAQPSDYAYFIHTSGSTGQPKCVTHTQGSVDWHTHMTLLGSGLCRKDDVVLQVADCSFDLHLRDVYCFLSFGGHVVTVPAQALSDMDLLTELFYRHQVTWVECVPLIFTAAVNYLDVSNLWFRLQSLRVWSCIGAAYQLPAAQLAHRSLPNLQFVNSFAPTENCFVTTVHRVTKEELALSDKLYSTPIGRPVSGWQCWLLDEEEEPYQRRSSKFCECHNVSRGTQH
uniref:AMP-dependent synthetase/ligase domain-containing protein n=1 Tax=Eutreptiella gymnastica TaxID=73025 RepID=A0A7S4CMW6_9EUGL